MKKTAFSFLVGMALCLLAGLPLQARGPVIDPGAISDPSCRRSLSLMSNSYYMRGPVLDPGATNGPSRSLSLMYNNFYMAANTTSVAQTANLSTRLFDRFYEVEAGEVNNTSETVTRNSAVNTIDTPFISVFFTE